MPGKKPVYAKEIRDHVISRVLDHRDKLQPLIRQLNAGELEGFPATPVSYSTACDWIKKARRELDAAAQLEDTTLDQFTRRIWAVAMAELRKVERDSAKAKPLDVKRLNDLEGVAARLRRHIARADDPRPSGEPPQEKPAQSPLLHSLAATQTDQDPEQPAVANPPTHPDTTAADRDPGPTDEEPDNESGEQAEPRSLVRVG